MSKQNPDPRDPKKLPDPVLGVETNDQITNSEDQQIVDDVVAENSDNEKTENESNVSEKDKKDITDIN